MSLQDKVIVNTHYTRSVNLERDAGSIDVINAYIPTSRALRTFSRIASAFHEGQAPRAWSLVGPYGSGKSSFSVFLSHLLADDELATTKAAQKILKQAEPELNKLFAKEIKNSNGYLKVLVTGAPEPMSRRLVKGMYDAAQNYWKNIKGRSPKILAELETATTKEELTTSDVLDLVKKLQVQLAKANCSGVLFVIDELGKFLEYEARHYGANDIYLLQSLAEHACEGNSVNLYLFVLLHQSFEQYAKGLGESLKNEWSKVQGRFEELPFLESAEQVLRVVSSAFEQRLTKTDIKKVAAATKNVVEVLIDQDSIPGVLSKKEAMDLFASCYPLHPVSAVLLPLLCQKVAQNERTLFSYLGSHEEYGLQDMLSKLEGVEDTVKPHHIFDYFISNQPAVMGDYLTHRRWAEVVTAIERLGDASQDEIELLKTIGILNIIGSKGGFKASKALLETCSKSKAAFKRAADSLQEKSVVNYRKFNKEYRVWQGSDFDLEAAIQEEANNLGNFSLAEELNNDSDMQPVVARRYTIESGTLRYFVPTFVDAQSYKTLPEQSDEARIIFYLAAGQDDEKSFRKTVSKHFSPLDITVLCLSGSQLREAVAENLALKRVVNSRQELNTDPVAKREFDDRLTAAEQSQVGLLQNLIDSPADSEWWNAGEKLVIKNKRALQVALSTVLRAVYSKAPIIKNEMMNRNKPSSQATAARNKLLFAMLYHESEKDLGINKFPPEKSIYRAVLQEAGLHLQDESSEWKFVSPDAKDKKAKASCIKYVWKRIDDFLASTEKQAKSFAELNAELMAPPYGVKAGLLPIFYIAAYIVNQHELAIYESRAYRPYFTEEMLDRFVKRPDEFTVQRFRLVGVKADVFKQYGEVIQSKDGSTPTLLELAKPLASFMAQLPEYTQKTRKGLSDRAQAVRQAFNLSKSPERLLFAQLPKALGYDLDAKNTDLVGFSSSLKDVLGELKRAYEKLLEKQIQLIATATKSDAEDTISGIRKKVYGQYAGLENYTVDTQGLRAFIMRLTKTTGSDEEWFENILMFLGHKPSAKWLDSDQDQAEYRLAKFAKDLVDLRKLQLHEHSQSKADPSIDVYLLRSFKQGGHIQDDVFSIDEAGKKATIDIKQKLMKSLSNVKDTELRMAVLAQVVDEFLLDYHQGSKAVSEDDELESSTLKEVKK
jgi:hypothetical protein